jgi:hypothetical protein|tara:strand:+ start:267 stop:596 length:330 start_codon:yes stop_codon:yes gene_type:complete
MARKAKELSEDTGIGLDVDGDGKADFSISLKTIGMIVVGLATLIGAWFTLQADIQEAKELPAPVIERMEFDMKDELIRQTIMDTQEDVEKIQEQLDKIDQRLYDLQKNR